MIKMPPSLLLLCASLSACNLAPSYQRPDSPLPSTISSISSSAISSAEGSPESAATALPTLPELDWNWLAHPQLRQTVALALTNNRDLRVALENVEKARAQYGIARADELPSISAQTEARRSRSGAAGVGEQYSAQIGLASYELDLWGRVRNLKEAAWQQFLQTEANQRSIRISLIAEVANAWLTLAADQERLSLAEQTLEAREQSYALMRRMFELGASAGLALAQNLGTVEAARGDVAQYTAQVERSRNALQLLLGAALPTELLPPPQLLQQTGTTALQAVPEPLPSSVLLQRPDVQAAEHQLVAQNAQIGAARAALFPTISLTSNLGWSSSELDSLFSADSRSWSFAPQLRLPIFSGGRLQAGVEVAEANQRIALAQYEKTLQTAFREVADVLADRAQWDKRLGAQNGVVTTSSKTLELSQARFDAGADDYLSVLDAQRSLYAAQQTLISLRLSEQQNRVALWKVLGGGNGGATSGYSQAPTSSSAKP